MSVVNVPRPVRSAGPAPDQGPIPSWPNEHAPRHERTPATGTSRFPLTRIVMALLLLATGALYLFGLGAAGHGNTYYAAAAQAGATSWKALLFGAVDAAGGITVDKPPASLWLMAVSVKAFGGASGFALMLPQALCGIGSVALLAAAVRRVSGAWAGIAAGAMLAVTPVATSMFRYDHPDALLVLCMTGAAYAVVRGIEGGKARWAAIAGTLLGIAFLAKMFQAFLVMPGFVLVYLVAAPMGLVKRVGHVLLAACATVLSAGWWIALVELWPAGSRPYIGGSRSNSALELALGYNGLQRISSGDQAGGGGGMSFSGVPGIGRLFNAQLGTEIAWLLPAAIVALLIGVTLRAGRHRTDRVRASLLLWGGWAVVTALTFSFMSGVIHSYYAVALAPALAALVAIGGTELWRARTFVEIRVVAALGAVLTGVTGFVLLNRASTWHPELRWVVLGASVLGAFAIVANGRSLISRSVSVGALCVALLLGPLAFSIATAKNPQSGSMPTSGPSSFATSGGGPVGGGFARDGQGEATTTSTSSSSGTTLVELLRASDAKWAAATQGTQSAASLELEAGSDVSVLGMGGWSGDPFPTLAQFQSMVADGDIGYLVSGGGRGGGPGGSNASSEIAAWVAANYDAVTTSDGTTVYDLQGQ